MPNTNPSDLDREALKAALRAYDDYWENDIDPDDAMKCAISGYLSALPRASGVPEAEAVEVEVDKLIRERDEARAIVALCNNSLFGSWGYFTEASGKTAAQAIEDLKEYARKYWRFAQETAAPPPVAAPSGEALAEDVAGDFEITYRDYVWAKGCADFIRRTIIHYWRVNAPPSPIASEPKDTGSGEGQGLTVEEQVRAFYSARIYVAGQLLKGEAMINALHAAGYHITRPAPIGAKP